MSDGVSHGAVPRDGVSHGAVPLDDLGLSATARLISDQIHKLGLQVVDLNSRIYRSEKREFRLSLFSILLGLSLLLSVAVGYDVYSSTACQIGVNTSFRHAIDARTAAASTDRTSQRRLVDTLLNSSATPEERRQALVLYNEGLATADKQRQDNPLPEQDCSRPLVSRVFDLF